MGFKFGKASKRRAKGVDSVLVEIADEALSVSAVDMTIPWRGGYRTSKQQNEIYLRGASRADGYDKKSFHQSGKALDVIPYFDGKGHYEDVDQEFIDFAILMFMVFDNEKEAGEIPQDVYLHWAGLWKGVVDTNKDGKLEAGVDRLSWDLAHYELRDYPQKKTELLK